MRSAIVFVLCSLLLRCTSDNNDVIIPQGDLTELKESYGWALVGESLLKQSPVDRMRILINRPLGMKIDILTVSKFNNHFLICQKNVSGMALRKEFVEVCKAVEAEQFYPVWQTSVGLMQNQARETHTSRLADYPTATLELYVKGGESIKIETDLCDKVIWPIVLVDEILSSKLEIALPPCPPSQ